VSPSARDAAFGSTPHRIPRAAVDPEERWLVAVALGGQGYYAAAAAELERLAADPAVPLRVAAHAAVTRAAHLRQLGGHAVARSWDARGLRLAAGALRAGAAPTGPRIGGVSPRWDSTGGVSPRCDGVANGDGPAGCPCDGLDAAAARIDALVGLAADAVGLGDLAGAERLLAAAAAELARLAADPAVPLGVAAHAAVTRAAHLRQLGGHAAARPHDARGLRLATVALRGPTPPHPGAT